MITIIIIFKCSGLSPGRFLRGIVRKIFPIVASLLFFSSLLASAQNPIPPAGLAQAGSKALKEFLPALDSPKMKKTHGFAPEDDLSAVTLGEPFETRYLLVESTKEYVKGAKVENFLIESRNWFFPVLSRGSQACLLSVIQNQDGSFQKDKLGMAQLARVWAAVLEAWPVTKGYTPLLVVMPSRQRFYFTVPQAQPPNLTRICIEQAESASVKLYKNLTPADVAFEDLRD
ncbi:MAG: hypothetical protein WC637_01630 [Victivallales bacterium]|jgi:hypothetical protein